VVRSVNLIKTDNQLFKNKPGDQKL